MESILHVKNFGPIKDAKLDLRNVNVLIGPQASGKSTLAKLFTICKSPRMYFELEKTEQGMFSVLEGEPKINLKEPSHLKFLESLDFFSLSGYMNPNSEIVFESPTHSVRITHGALGFNDNLQIGYLEHLEKINDKEKIIQFALGLDEKSSLIRKKCAVQTFVRDFIERSGSTETGNILKEFDHYYDNIDIEKLYSEENISIFIRSAYELRASVFGNNAVYIPAERTIVNLIKQASLNFQRSNIPISGSLLDYAARYETASFAVKKFNLSFLSSDAEYRYENGEDRIYFSKDKSVRLTDSASGFQSVVPMILPLVHSPKEKSNLNSTFVIEEPETNLFPGAQYEVLKFIEKGRENDFGMIDKGGVHIYTTHSPFILTSLNNMLFAYKKGSGAQDYVKSRVHEVIPKENWINPIDFAAYEIKNGKAESIFNRKTGLISESVIDVVSEEIMNDFRKIAVASTTNAE